MVFVTVGTHEQQFNRLIKFVDGLVGSKYITEPVIIQTGYSTCVPLNCQWNRIISYNDMVENVLKARIVITHGGPSSFIMPLEIGKIPIVVPRQKQFNEHVNNHQVEFVQAVYKRHGNVIPVYEIESLSEVIANYEDIITRMPRERLSNNKNFNRELAKIVKRLI